MIIGIDIVDIHEIDESLQEEDSKGESSQLLKWILSNDIGTKRNILARKFAAKEAIYQ